MKMEHLRPIPIQHISMTFGDQKPKSISGFPSAGVVLMNFT
jgi:hypothetical protein